MHEIYTMKQKTGNILVDIDVLESQIIYACRTLFIYIPVLSWSSSGFWNNLHYISRNM